MADCLPAALLRFKPWYKGFMRGGLNEHLAVVQKKNVCVMVFVEVVGGDVRIICCMNGEETRWQESTAFYRKEMSSL